MVLVRDLSFVGGWALLGTALVATLRLWNAGPGLTDLFRTGLGIAAYLLFAWVVWRHRRTMAVAVAGAASQGPLADPLRKIVARESLSRS